MPELDDLRSPSVVQLTSSDLSASDLVPIYHAATNTIRRIPAQDLGGLATNATVVAAIEDDPAAVVTELSVITDTSSTTISLVAADSGKILRCTSSSSVTINMPSTDPGGNFSVAVIRAGTGSVTFAANGKTLNSYNSLLAIAGQHAWASLIRVAANTYNLSGTLA
jgi:hypothetical protein